jgi:ElaB/YqjD/DUF883 family membrane-anchored ribosome-binding protein
MATQDASMGGGGSSSASGGSTPFPTSDPTSSGSMAGSGSSVGGNGASASPDVLNRVVQGAHQTIDKLAERAAPHVQRLQEGVHTASDRLHTGADDLRVMRDDWTETLRCTVRENPIAAVATALAVGLLIARLTR